MIRKYLLLVLTTCFALCSFESAFGRKPWHQGKSWRQKNAEKYRELTVRHHKNLTAKIHAAATQVATNKKSPQKRMPQDANNPTRKPRAEDAEYLKEQETLKDLSDKNLFQDSPGLWQSFLDGIKAEFNPENLLTRFIEKKIVGAVKKIFRLGSSPNDVHAQDSSLFLTFVKSFLKLFKNTAFDTILSSFREAALKSLSEGQFNLEGFRQVIMKLPSDYLKNLGYQHREGEDQTQSLLNALAFNAGRALAKTLIEKGH